MDGKFKEIVCYIGVGKGHVTSCNHVNMHTMEDAVMECFESYI